MPTVMNEGRGEGLPTQPPNPDRPLPATIISESGGEEQPRALTRVEQVPLPAGGTAFLSSLIRLQLLTPESVREFLDDAAVPLSGYTDAEAIGNDLVQNKLLTDY